MNKTQPTLTYTFSFLILALVFKFIGLLQVSNEEILSYTFIFYGISTVYLSLGKNKKFRVFLGSAVFFTGIVFFVINDFDIFNTSRIILPSIILIPGLSCLMLYIEDTQDKSALYISLTLILIGLVYSFTVGYMNPLSFVYSVYHIVLKYWVIALISLIIFTAIKHDE